MPPFRTLLPTLQQGALWLMACAFSTGSMAQCGPAIGTFPYSEGFEAGPAWTSGGTASDWAWGTPAHASINSAGGGTKSWCVGGLTGAFYNNNERSWLESPCFDFTNLNTPRISFKIFWEVERQYDGITFQYSTNGGVTYSNVGAFNEPANCNTANWFNSSNLTNLPASISPKHGWSGRQGPTQGSCQGGNGSMGWVTAKHCLGWLANAPSVRFRFFFGAGSVCNNFDGIAIDDILIDESDPVVASFSGDCNGTSVNFTNTSTPCPDTFSWNFGDPGSQNTSVQGNPTHTYANPGTYTVTLTATDVCGASNTTTQNINILGVTITTTAPTCGQNNGALNAVVTGAGGAVNYLWSPGGATTQTLPDAAPGNYTVTVSAVSSCSASANATLAPSVGNLALTVNHTDVTCAGLDNGTVTASTTGGVAPITFLWAPGGEGTAQLNGLAPGIYSCTVTDATGCSDQQSATVVAPMPLLLMAGPDTAVCAGTTVTMHAEASGGTPGYTYTWTAGGPVVTPQATTSYSVTATDAVGCASAPATATVTVASAFQVSFSASDTMGCAPHCTDLTASPQGAASYIWDLGDGTTATGGDPVHCYANEGAYAVSLIVTDATGCTGTATRPDLITVFPKPVASFTPDPAVAIISDPLIQFNNTSRNATDHLWNFGDPANTSSVERSPGFTYAEVGCYTVTLGVSSGEGCRDSTSAVVCVEDPYSLYMPNAFSPNGDDINDVFLPRLSVRDPKAYRMSIFDRWGAQLFTTTAVDEGWDGGTTGMGVYVWKVWITDSQGDEHEAIGHVTLLR